jgi:hypothetical protein
MLGCQDPFALIEVTTKYLGASNTFIGKTLVIYYLAPRYLAISVETNISRELPELLDKMCYSFSDSPSL